MTEFWFVSLINVPDQIRQLISVLAALFGKESFGWHHCYIIEAYTG